MAEQVEMDEYLVDWTQPPPRGSRPSRPWSGGKKLNPRSGSGSKRGSRSRSSRFPSKLHDMLSRDDLSDGIIEWIQDGTCFKIIDRDRLSEKLLPIYFVSALSF